MTDSDAERARKAEEIAAILGGTYKPVPPPPPPPQPPVQARTDAEKEADIRALSGPTLFVNRVVVQTYGDGTVRLVFAEQFTPHQDLPPAFRQAVFMHPQTAAELVRQLVNALPGEHIPIFDWEKERQK